MGIKRPEIWSAPGGELEEEKLKKAAQMLREGELIAFPTETVYGVGTDAWSRRAVERLSRAKNRPPDMPFSLQLSRPEDAEGLTVSIPGAVKDLIDTFWPGPLTLVLPAAERVPFWMQGPGGTVGLRLPDILVARELPRFLGRPMASTSANLSGRPSPTTVDHVLADLGQEVGVVIDSGESGWGLESTVLDLTRPQQPRVLRQGTLEVEALEKILKQKITILTPTERPHYRPKVPLFTCTDEQKALEVLSSRGYLRISLLSPRDPIPGIQDFQKIRGDREGIKEFYRLLREAEEKADAILARPPEKGPYAGLITQRLYKAAVEHIGEAE